MTIRDFIEAIRKNGVPQHFGSLYQVETEEEDWDGILVKYTEDSEVRNGKILGACALGQAFINLNVENEDLFSNKVNDAVRTARGDAEFKKQYFTHRVVDLNDGDMKSFEEIADQLTREYSDVLDVEIPA